MITNNLQIILPLQQRQPDAIQTEIDIFAHGFAIKNNFVVGYGLDFDGLGRNLPSIYINQDSE